MNTGMIPVFEEKLKKLLKKIEKQYELPKEERDKNFLKRMAREAKSLRKMLKQCRDEMGGQCCPKCGHEMDIM